jgi:hypothetical protein
MFSVQDFVVSAFKSDDLAVVMAIVCSSLIVFFVALDYVLSKFGGWVFKRELEREKKLLKTR